MTKEDKKKHATFGASSASRWLNCPGSIQLCETVPPQKQSEYALEGTAAHKLAEICLLRDMSPDHFLEQEINLNEKGETPHFVAVTQDMIDAVTIYVDYVKSRAKLGDLAIETQFSLNHIHEGMFGTNDACVYSQTLGMLEVIDYKHGAGIPVSPVENAQLAYYGLGAAKIYKLHPKSQIILTIVQPRANGEAIKSWETTVGYLEKFAEVLKKGVKAAKAKTPKLETGSWCRFCPAQAVCPKMQETALEVAKAEFNDEQIVLPEPSSLAKVDIKKVLDFSKTLSSWLNAVETYAFNSLERGEPIEGYKLVKKRANRKWKDEDQTARVLTEQLGLGLNAYTNPKLKSPAQIEALKIDKNLVASLCETPDNGNTMVPVSDKRPEVLPTLAQAEFDEIEICE